jgi:hypothetical protein
MHFDEQVTLAERVVLSAIQANSRRTSLRVSDGLIEAPCSKLQGIFDCKELAIL